eukprot:scaffold5131_cov68-Phaeocystis_antarctica.AAC.4
MCEQQIEGSERGSCELGFCPALLDLVLEQSPIFKRICQGCIISRRRVDRASQSACGDRHHQQQYNSAVIRSPDARVTAYLPASVYTVRSSRLATRTTTAYSQTNPSARHAPPAMHSPPGRPLLLMSRGRTVASSLGGGGCKARTRPAWLFIYSNLRGLHTWPGTSKYAQRWLFSA